MGVATGLAIGKGLSDCGKDPVCGPWIREHVLLVSFGIPGVMLALILISAWLSGEFGPKKRRKK